MQNLYTRNKLWIMCEKWFVRRIVGWVNCFPILAPCTANAYRSQLDYQVARMHSFQGTTYILFEKHAVVHKASFSIGQITLLSRIGGYIGGGRTLFWMIVGGCGLLKAFLDCLKNIKNWNQDCNTHPPRVVYFGANSQPLLTNFLFQ